MFVQAELAKYENYLISGSMDDLDDDSILLRVGFASQLNLAPGDEVDVYTPLMGCLTIAVVTRWFCLDCSALRASTRLVGSERTRTRLFAP